MLWSISPKTTDCNIVVIDKLSYASLGYDRLRSTGVFDIVSQQILSSLSRGHNLELGTDIEFITYGGRNSRR